MGKKEEHESAQVYFKNSYVVSRPTLYPKLLWRSLQPIILLCEKLHFQSNNTSRSKNEV